MMMGQSHTLNCNYSLWPPPVTPPPPPPTRTTYISGRSNNWKGKNCHVSAVGDISSRRRSRWFHKNKKFSTRFVPFAPRNTTSFIIRAKRCGGIASRMSPCPVTPAVLPTPEFSPAREVLVDMAKEEWGVDGYGSMNGLIRLRSLGHDADDEEEGEGEIGGGLSDSAIEARIEMERRLDHDVSRFEMIYPNGGDEQHISRFDDQNTHISQLQDENITLRERLVVMEKELEDLRRRVRCLENNVETSGNDSENDVRGGGGDLCSANNSCVNGD